MLMPILSLSMQLEACMKASKNTVRGAIGSLVADIRRKLDLKEIAIGIAKAAWLHLRETALVADKRPFAPQHFPDFEKLQGQAEARRVQDEALARIQLARQAAR
jgi:hypothetical protein